MSQKYKRFDVAAVLSVGLVLVLSGTLLALDDSFQLSGQTAQLAQTSTFGTLTDQDAVVDTQITDPSNTFKGPYEVTPAEKNDHYNWYPYTNRTPSGMRGARPGRARYGMGPRLRGGGSQPSGISVKYLYETALDPAQNQDPEMFKLIQADQDAGLLASQLARKIRIGKPGTEGVDRKAELTKLVNEHFDVRQKRRELELKRLEEQLARLREVIKRRSDSRELIVGKRLSELLGEQYELDF